jgi:hypothetical protein
MPYNSLITTGDFIISGGDFIIVGADYVIAAADYVIAAADYRIVRHLAKIYYLCDTFSCAIGNNRDTNVGVFFVCLSPI